VTEAVERWDGSALIDPEGVVAVEVENFDGTKFASAARDSGKVCPTSGTSRPDAAAASDCSSKPRMPPRRFRIRGPAAADAVIPFE
jgi:hypothetical protein